MHYWSPEYSMGSESLITPTFIVRLFYNAVKSKSQIGAAD